MAKKKGIDELNNPITILVDLYKTKNAYSGLGQFSIQFAKALLKNQTTNSLLSFLIPKNYPFKKVDHVNYITSSFFNKILSRTFKQYSIWHSLHQFPTHKPSPQSKWILTIHDLNFMIEKTGIKRSKYLNQLQKNINKADCITTISEFSKQEIIKHLNVNSKDVRVIYNGVLVSHTFSKPDFVNFPKFFFSIGIFNAKKNFHTLIPMMKLFPDYHLVIAGNKNTAYGKSIQLEIDRLGLSNRVLLPGTITEENKSWLFKNCEAFLFPSLAEGFGMPVIEAMNFGKPTFLSTATSLPEIGGEIAYYFENFEVNEMASLIKESLETISKDQHSFSEKSKKHASKFSWDNSIQKYQELYKELTQ